MLHSAGIAVVAALISQLNSDDMTSLQEAISGCDSLAGSVTGCHQQSQGWADVPDVGRHTCVIEIPALRGHRNYFGVTRLAAESDDQ